MKTITIDISDTEYKALAYVAVSPEEWIQNLIKIRIQDAVDEIVNIELQHRFANNLPIPSDKMAIVDESVLPSAKTRNDNALITRGKSNESN